MICFFIGHFAENRNAAQVGTDLIMKIACDAVTNFLQLQGLRKAIAIKGIQQSGEGEEYSTTKPQGHIPGWKNGQKHCSWLFVPDAIAVTALQKKSISARIEVGVSSSMV